MISIRARTVYALTIGYIALPVLLFFAGWLRGWIGIPLALLTAGAVVLLAKKETDEKRITFKSWTVIAGLFTVVLLWVFLSGQGGYFYQSNDHHWRNATFRDLVDFPWPVIYPKTNAALVYYIAYWLPAAAVGKLFGWGAANAALFVWTTIGVSLCVLLLFRELEGKTALQCFIILAVFMLWSGMDIIGTVTALLTTGKANFLHLEWWSGFYQFSSNTTQLFWVYNQSVVPWLITLLLLRQRHPGKIALICALAFPFAPMPFIGLLPFAVYFAALGLRSALRAKTVKRWVGTVFSLYTLAAVAIVLPFALYYASNATIESQRSIWFWSGAQPLWAAITMYVLFLLLEFLLLAALLFPRYKREPLYYVVCVSLMLFPLFAVGKAADFCMRASIPALILLMVMSARLLLERVREGKMREPLSMLLVAFLLVGAVTPAVEVGRGLSNVIRAGKINLVADRIKTFSDKGDDYSNFLAFNAQEKPFYRYLARLNRPDKP